MNAPADSADVRRRNLALVLRLSRRPRPLRPYRGRRRDRSCARLRHGARRGTHRPRSGP
ncbi:hypothetical protein ACRAWF_38560 [Streptomyces sp. L7]